MSSEKIQVTTTPALPSLCAVCHTHAKGVTRFIDFGSDIDYYGAIVICELCIVNAAETLGTLVPVAKYDQAVVSGQGYFDRLVAEKEKVKALESLIAAYGFDRHVDFGPLADLDLALPLGETDETDITSSDSESGSGQQGSSESSTV